MYSKDGKGSPTMARDEETGEMGVTRHKAKEKEAGADGAIKEDGDEAMPHHIRHAMARHDLHKRHEAEHMVHDHHNGGDKKELHDRHEKEAKVMHASHEKEMMKGEPAKKESGEKEIKKIEQIRSN